MFVLDPAVENCNYRVTRIALIPDGLLQADGVKTRRPNATIGSELPLGPRDQGNATGVGVAKARYAPVAQFRSLEPKRGDPLTFQR